MLFMSENITKKFGGLTALSKINVEIEECEVVGMIGSNGSGKTTFVNVCTGFLKPEDGRIKLGGKDITRLTPHERVGLGIARTYQSTKLFRNLTVDENMVIANQMHYHRLNRNDVKEGIDEVLDRMGLIGKGEVQSGGLTLFEQKKLEIGMRLIGHPKLLMLDEPVGGLNPSEINDMLLLLKELRKDLTLFIIEHTMKVIFSLADRVVVLNSGIQLADGTPKEISMNQAVIDAYLGSYEQECE